MHAANTTGLPLQGRIVLEAVLCAHVATLGVAAAALESQPALFFASHDCSQNFRIQLQS